MGSLVAEIAERVASSSAGARSELEIRGGAASPGTLLLSTAETTVVDGNKLGQIDFQAPVDQAGTDAILVAASIYAEADATFSSSVNQTELVFATGASEAAAEKMRLTSDGKLGIGIATPDSKLHVEGTDPGSGNALIEAKLTGNSNNPIMMLVNENTGGNATDNNGLWIDNRGGSGATYSIRVLNSSTEIFAVRASGQVGIGTVTPDQKLVVVGTGNVASKVESFTTTAAQGALLILSRSNNGTLGTQTAVDADDLLGGIYFQGSSGTGFTSGSTILSYADETWSGTASGSTLRFYTADNTTTTLDERMRIDHNGKIGIGTTAPSKEFQVSAGTFSIINGGQDDCFQFSGPHYDGPADPRNAGGRALANGQRTVSNTTTTTIFDAGWGGMVCVGYAGTGQQGLRFVSYGYAGTPAVHSSYAWVGSCTVTFSTSSYALNVWHNAGNDLTFWMMGIGI